MTKDYQRAFSWDFYSKLIILSFSMLQILRFRVAPQFIDIYYHLLTAGGFLKAGGYSGWDFWQYAPYGRVHIYPPFFHIILAFLIKSGINGIIIAKLFETVMPIAFLLVIWDFIKKNYDDCLAFFVILTAISSFSFYLSLMNHVPATLAIIFGILAFDQMFRTSLLRAAMLLALCFYTHIGVAWFFAFTFIFYGLINRQYGKKCLVILASALILSMPIIFKQLVSLRYVKSIGLNLNEVNFSQIKVVDYFLAFLGLMFIFKMERKYLFFLSLFLASLMFILYPYRLFSSEGYLPIILLSAVFLHHLHKKIGKKYLFLIAVIFILFISPTIKLDRPLGQDKTNFKLSFSDSAFMGMQLARGPSVWFPRQYLQTAKMILANSKEGDIIYASIDFMGVALASLSGRPSANALLPEIKSYRKFDPYVSSKIIIFAKDDDLQVVNSIVNFYKLEKIGETELFWLFKNPLNNVKFIVKKASVSFWLIIFIGFAFFLLFWQDKRVEKYFKYFKKNLTKS